MAIHLNVYIRARKRTQKNKNWKGIDFFFFWAYINLGRVETRCVVVALRTAHAKNKIKKCVAMLRPKP